MPIISQFYGIIIQMFFNEKGKHNQPRIHVKYNEYKAVNNLEGDIIGVKPLENYCIYLKFENGEDIAPENLYYESITLDEYKKNNSI